MDSSSTFSTVGTILCAAGLVAATSCVSSPSPRREAGPSPSAAVAPEIVATDVPAPFPIAFHSDPGGSDDLFSVGIGERRPNRLTENLEAVATPYWSPDGRYLAFLAPNGSTDVHLLDVRAREIHNLTDSPEEEGEIAWSPDGSSIAFTRYEVDEILVTSIDTGATTPLTDSPGVDGGASWSPDGEQIAFHSDRNGDLNVFTAGVDGTQVRQVTSRRGEDCCPAWSPDGRYLAFTARDRGDHDVRLWDARNESIRTVGTPELDQELAAWAPSGRTLLMTTYYADADSLSRGIGNAEIFTVDADGGHESRLTRNSHWDGDPAWSPDGRHIVFSAKPGPLFQLYVMTRDGTDVARLAGVGNSLGGGNDCCPAWRPAP